MTKTRRPDGTQLFHCPVEATMSKIGGKYKAIVLYHLKEDGVLRFSELARYLPQATPRCSPSSFASWRPTAWCTARCTPSCRPRQSTR